MASKIIDAAGKFWSPIADEIVDVLKDCGFPIQSLSNYFYAYFHIMVTYYKIQEGKGYMMESTLFERLRSYFTRPDVPGKVLECKWLFHRTRWEGYKKDYVIQPIIDPMNLDKEKFNFIRDDIKAQDYKMLCYHVPLVKRRIPNCGGNLFSSKDVAVGEPKGVAESPSNGQSASQSASQSAEHSAVQSVGHSAGHSDGSKGARVYIDKDKDIDIDKDSSFLLKSEERTVSRKEESGIKGKDLIPLEDFLSSLRVESVEGRDLLAGCPEHEKFFSVHFEELKAAYRRRVSTTGHYEEYKLATYQKQIGYFSNCLANSKVANYLVKEIEKELKKKAQALNTNSKYPYETLLADGRRMCCGEIIPQDAPPRPSKNAKWTSQGWLE